MALGGREADLAGEETYDLAETGRAPKRILVCVGIQSLVVVVVDRKVGQRLLREVVVWRWMTLECTAAAYTPAFRQMAKWPIAAAFPCRG